MHRPRTRSQVRRDDEKAERRRALKEEKAKRHREREKRRATAQYRESKSHHQSSGQQTFHNASSAHTDRHGNISEVFTHTIDDGIWRTRVTTATNAYTGAPPTHSYSLPFHSRRSQPQSAPVYTEVKPAPRTYYAEERRPMADERRWDTRGYQSPGPTAKPKPWPSSRQTSRPSHERGHPRTRAPETSPPRPETAPSVIEPACISEPETVVAAPKNLRPKDIVTMLPTPPPSVTKQPPPSSTEYTRAPSQTKRPATDARQTGSGSSWQYHGRLATQSSNAPSIPPATRSAKTEDGSHILPTEETLRRSATTIPSTSSRPASPPTNSRPHRRGGLPSIFDQAPNLKAAWEIYDDTTASEFHRNREAPISSQSKREPSPSKTPSTAKTREGANTEKAAKAERPAETTAGTQRKRGPRLGANIGYDPRDRL